MTPRHLSGAQKRKRGERHKEMAMKLPKLIRHYCDIEAEKNERRDSDDKTRRKQLGTAEVT